MGASLERPFRIFRTLIPPHPSAILQRAQDWAQDRLLSLPQGARGFGR